MTDFLTAAQITALNGNLGVPMVYDTVAKKMIDGDGGKFPVLGAGYTSRGLGLKHDGSDESTTLQGAIDFVWAANGDHGACIVVPNGMKTVAQGIIMRPGVWVVSESAFTNLTETAAQWWGHRFELPTVATMPLFQNDTANGYIRQLSNDSPQLNQRYSGGGFMGLTMAGSQHVTNHTTDCDLLRLTRCWCFSVVGCSLISSRGFGMRLLDCNVLNILDSNSLAAPVFADSMADSLVRGGQYGLGNGLSSTPFWISDSQKNQIQGVFIYNNQANGALGITTRFYAFPMVAATVNISTDSNPNTILFATNAITGDNAHRWTLGTPVTVSSTGTLPAPLVADQTYFVIPINSGRIALATSRERANSGAVVVLTTAGSGTITVQVGENTNLYVNSGSTKNRISGIRSDQAFGAAILVGKASANAISDVIAQENSFGNYVGWQPAGQPAPSISPVASPAVILRNGATGTSLGGTWSVDGTKTGTFGQATGFESRQLNGFSVDSSSRPGTVFATTANALNHTTANSDTGAENYTPTDVNPNRIAFPAAQFANITGSTVATFGGARRSGWSMGTTTDCFVGTEVQVPAGWSTVRATLYWVPSAAGAGNVMWASSLAGFAVGDNTNAADPVTTAAVASAAGGQDVLASAVLSSALDFSGLAGKSVYLRVKHAGTDAGNTFASAPVFSHIVLEKIG